MKTTHLLLALSLASAPAWAETSTHKKGQALPPKWGTQIQPAPAPDPGAPAPGLINSDLGGKDLQFLMEAIQHGRLQAWLCKMTKEKGEAEQVRAIGDTLQYEQEQENGLLGKLAAKRGLVLPVATVATGQPKLQEELGALTGAKFDKVVMEKIITGAQGDVTGYESASQSSDAEVKSLAERLLPLAKEKLLLASKISGRSQTSGSQPIFRDGGPNVRRDVPPVAPVPPKPPATPAPPVKPAAVATPAPATPKPATPVPATPKPMPATPLPAATPAGLATPLPLPKPTAMATPLPKPPATPATAMTPVPLVKPATPFALPAGTPPPRPQGPKPVPPDAILHSVPPATPAPGATPVAK